MTNSRHYPSSPLFPTRRSASIYASKLAATALLFLLACTNSPRSDAEIAETLARQADHDVGDSPHLQTPRQGQRVIFSDTSDDLPRRLTFQARAGAFFEIAIYARNFTLPTFSVHAESSHFQRHSPTSTTDSIAAHRQIYIPQSGTYEILVATNSNQPRNSWNYVGYLEQLPAPTPTLISAGDTLTGRFTDLSHNLYELEPPDDQSVLAPRISYDDTADPLLTTLTSRTNSDTLSPYSLHASPSLLFPESNRVNKRLFLLDYIQLPESAEDLEYKITTVSAQQLQPGDSFDITQEISAGEMVHLTQTNLEKRHLNVEIWQNGHFLYAQPLPSNSPTPSPFTELAMLATEDASLRFRLINDQATTIHPLNTSVEVLTTHDLDPLSSGEELDLQFSNPTQTVYHIITLSDPGVFSAELRAASHQSPLSLHLLEGTPPFWLHASYRGHEIATIHAGQLDAGVHLLRVDLSGESVETYSLSLSLNPPQTTTTTTIDLEIDELLTLRPTYDWTIETSIFLDDQLLAHRDLTLYEPMNHLLFLPEQSGTYEISASTHSLDNFSPTFDQLLTAVADPVVLGPTLEPAVPLILMDDELAALHTGNLVLDASEDLDLFLTAHSEGNQHLRINFRSLHDHGASAESLHYYPNKPSFAPLKPGPYLLRYPAYFGAQLEHLHLLPIAAPHLRVLHPDPELIPDNDPTSLTVDFIVDDPECSRLETLEVELEISHPRIADLRLEITAPSGLTATLRDGLEQDPSSLYLRYPFLTPSDDPLTLFAGEDPRGLWTLRITDTAPFYAGTLDKSALYFRCDD